MNAAYTESCMTGLFRDTCTKSTNDTAETICLLITVTILLTITADSFPFSIELAPFSSLDAVSWETGSERSL